jgi:calcineurin-like phosphoesterase family protein
MKTYIITDTHFAHPNIITYCHRPADADALIQRKWKNLVEPKDLVIHLGDVIWNRPSDLKVILAGLPGTKVLCRGNHDKGSNDFYRAAGFALVCNTLTLDGILFSHLPATTLPPDCTINLCGHFHNNPYDACFQYDLEYTSRLQPWHWVLSLEDMGYAPRSLKEILAGKWHRKDLPPSGQRPGGGDNETA